MKTFIFLSSIFLATNAFALKEELKTIEAGQVGPQVSCDSCSDQVNCPQRIVEQLRTGKLTFLGRDLLPGSDQNRSCVFRSESAYIIYRNCMGNKHEAPATSIAIIPFTGGMIDFYIENSSQVTDPISTLQRSQYDSTWRVSYSPTPAPGELNMEGIKTYLKAPHASGCYVGDSMGAQNMASHGNCYGGYKNSEWVTDAESFWKNPGPEWSRTLQQLRTKVSASY
ncbi:MAG: hypothetical protein ACJ76H_02765 [Bacteriovoracaceae bacterium]